MVKQIYQKQQISIDYKGKTISNEAHDKEATYTSKRGQKHHGHKMHIATDTNGVIKKSDSRHSQDP